MNHPLMDCPPLEIDKSAADVAAEGAILNEMLEIVAKRAALRPTDTMVGSDGGGGHEVSDDGCCSINYSHLTLRGERLHGGGGAGRWLWRVLIACIVAIVAVLLLPGPLDW